ncbi:MAG: 6-phosphofructokinase, partial [Candidatus Micrarchaeota archaeon]
MRIGVLTGGGDCPGLNAAIRSVFYRARENGWETVAIFHGWKGLLKGGKSKELSEAEVENIFDEGGTFIGSSRTNPYKLE